MHENNTKGLPEVYNQYLEADMGGEIDYIAFIHDDVSLQDSMFQYKIHQGMKSFDVLGLAGTNRCKVKKPALWHIMNNEGKPFLGGSGAVGHPNDKGQIHMSGYGPIGQRCVLMDGLCLIVNLNIIQEKGIRFDEDFKFHHYDLSFTLTCHDAGIKMGTVPIWVIHQSPGLLNINDTGFKKSEDMFVTKWKKK